MKSSTPLVVPLRQAGSAGAHAVGAKAATLSRLMAAGFDVPNGSVLTTAAWHRARELAGADAGAEPATTQGLALALPPEVSAALEHLEVSADTTTVAVRSSAVAEDGESASYAGQFETSLGVNGHAELTEAILRCWASADAAGVRSYGRRFGPTDTAVAVLIQQQVDPDVAGVAFTADPVTGERDRVLVSAVPGLGQGAVDGSVTPDEWTVDGRTATPLRVEHQSLTAQQAAAVADLARRIEDTLGGPQDVEWAMADGRLVVLQARPITGLPQAPRCDLGEGTWIKETDRHPEPLTAFGASVAVPMVAGGLSSMFAQYGGLLERVDMVSVGGELYSRAVPFGGHDGTPPPWWLLGVLCRVVPAVRRRMRSANRAMQPGVLEGIADEWWTRWRPQLDSTVRRLREVDLAGLTDSALADHLHEVHAETEHAMAVHFRMIPPYLVPVHQLVETCSELLGWTATESLGLLAGTSTTTSEPVSALAALGGRVRTDHRALAAVLDPAAGAAQRLAETSPQLSAAYRDWCTRYGYRNVNNDPGSPLLVELPWLLESLLREATRATASQSPGDSATDPETDPADRARSLMVHAPARDRAAFEAVHAAALRAYPLREDVAFSGSCFGGCARLTVLEAGRRLVARGALGQAEDAVHLPIERCQSALRGRGNAADLRAQVRTATAERAWVRLHPGPAFHGPPPATLPDLRGLPRSGRRLNEALLWMQQPAPTRTGDENNVLSGVPAAAGRHTGTARIVLSSSDFDRLQPGDVLVCRTTDPSWTVLFGIAGALVTDGGGVLSHGAIVARESAIPAVVGTTNATTLLADGQIITVDGATGTVAIPAPTP